MSSAAAPVLPDPQAAYNLLLERVHANTFFQKLAAYGYHPRNQKEATDLMELAGKLRVAREEPAIKAAAERSPFAEASASLDQYLYSNGLGGNVKAAAEREQQIACQKAAAALAADPDIYNAALSLKSAEAAQIAAQLGLSGQPA